MPRTIDFLPHEREAVQVGEDLVVSKFVYFWHIRRVDQHGNRHEVLVDGGLAHSSAGVNTKDAALAHARALVQEG